MLDAGKNLRSTYFIHLSDDFRMNEMGKKSKHRFPNCFIARTNNSFLKLKGPSAKCLCLPNPTTQIKSKTLKIIQKKQIKAKNHLKHP
jgi:hypothetical protein